MGWINEIKKVNTSNNKFSQYGEECYLKFIIDNIGFDETTKFLVDVGAGDGEHLSNTKIFRDDGWDSILIDSEDYPGIKRHKVTVENIIPLLEIYNCPLEPDLLSIDIDGNDFWILLELLRYYKPRLIISEYNSEHDDCKTIKYDPEFTFPFTDYYGYTAKAGLKLAEKNGYTVIFQNSNLNMYYLRNDLLPEGEVNEVNFIKHPWWKIPGKGEWINV